MLRFVYASMPFLYINKPKTWTSHDVVAKLRGITRIKKIGHAGTLDPFATGVLVVGIERDATKQLDAFKNLQKEYEVVAHFGATSDTQDSDGTITQSQNPTPITAQDLKNVFPQFLGEISQIPPMYSAKKIDGKKLYELARQGKEIPRQPSTITIYTIELLTFKWPTATLRVACGTGTYIRTLIHDIGQTLGTGAYAQELTRTRIGNITLDQCHPIQHITTDNWKSLSKPI